jgi:hypothetical protein
MKKILLIIFLMAYSVFFAEWFLRLLNPQAILPRYIQASEYGIRENIPNATYRHWTPEIEVLMSINNQGMRDHRTFPIKKPEGTCRVAIFGDSFFMGYEVNLEDSFAGQLESKLKKGNKNCEVLNFAVSGFGTAESLITLKKKAIQFEPDFVVLQWHDTDPNDNFRSNLFRINDDDQLVPTGNTYLPAVKIREKLLTYGIYRWAIEYSHLYSMAREKLGITIKNFLVPIKSFLKNSSNENIEETTKIVETVATEKHQGPGLNEKLVNAFCEKANSHDADCIILDIPNQVFNGDIITSYNFINIEHIKADAVLSPTELLKKEFKNGKELYRKKGHYHFNELGYSLTASVVSEYILSK